MPENRASDYVPVTGIHLKKIGDRTIVAAEIGGQWFDVISERSEGQFSHIVETAGLWSIYFNSGHPNAPTPRP